MSIKPVAQIAQISQKDTELEFFFFSWFLLVGLGTACGIFLMQPFEALKFKRGKKKPK